jgi:hypothetical protein
MNSLSYLRDDRDKQAVLISNSHGDSNRYTSSREKPDQQATRFSRSIRVWSWTIHPRGSRRQPFTSPHKDETCPYTQDKSWRLKTDWPGHRLGPPLFPSLTTALE